MTLRSLILADGYPALFVAMFLEGETLLAIAGFLALRAYLSLPIGVAVASAASFMSDQFCITSAGLRAFACLNAMGGILWSILIGSHFAILRMHFESLRKTMKN
jgi:membrane protein DedA with SNARE-associated domain